MTGYIVSLKSEKTPTKSFDELLKEFGDFTGRNNIDAIVKFHYRNSFQIVIDAGEGDAEELALFYKIVEVDTRNPMVLS